MTRVHDTIILQGDEKMSDLSNDDINKSANIVKIKDDGKIEVLKVKFRDSFNELNGWIFNKNK